MNKLEDQIKNHLWQLGVEEDEQLVHVLKMDMIDFAREAWRSGFVRFMMEAHREESDPPIDENTFPPTFEDWLKNKL